MSLIPPPDGFQIARQNPDGTLADTRTPQQRKLAQEKALAERKAKMASYEARTREAQEKLTKSAKGIVDKPEIPAPKDDLDLVMLNIMADPAGHLDGKGSATLRTLTDDQRRARARARMDEQSADARKVLDRAIKGDEDDEPDFGYALNYKGEELPEDLDDLHDELADDDAFDVGLNPDLEDE